MRAGTPAPRSHWSDYVFGVATMLVRGGYQLHGASLLVHGEVPIGAGLSSSAALEVASGLALLGVSNQPLDVVELAKICRKAENEYVGAPSASWTSLFPAVGARAKPSCSIVGRWSTAWCPSHAA